MKAEPATFKAWVEGLQWQFDLYKCEHGVEPDCAGEVLAWVRKLWKEFLGEQFRVYRFHRYSAGHQLEPKFRAWIEARIVINQAMK